MLVLFKVEDLETDATLRSLQRNEVLFEAGDLKSHLYRIETGALCIYVTHPDKTREIIEFALAGDVVGMGFLERHATAARAVVDTKVRCLALDEIDRLTAEDARAKSRFDDAVERGSRFGGIISSIAEVRVSSCSSRRFSSPSHIRTKARARPDVDRRIHWNAQSWPVISGSASIVLRRCSWSSMSWV